MSAEEWRPVPGFPGYFVSDQGQVRSDKGREPLLMKQRFLRTGYLKVNLCGPDGKRTRLVHQIVAEAFHGSRPLGMEVRHLDGVRVHNGADNLKWGTASENRLDRVRHGTDHNAAKTHCLREHPFNEANTYIDPRGRRTCRPCRRALDQRRWLQARARRQLRRQELRSAGIATERAA